MARRRGKRTRRKRTASFGRARAYFRRRRGRAKPRYLGLTGKAGALILGGAPAAVMAIEGGRGFLSLKKSDGTEPDIFTKLAGGFLMAVNGMATGFGLGKPFNEVPSLTGAVADKVALPQPIVPSGSLYVTTSVGLAGIVIDRVGAKLTSLFGGPKGGVKVAGMRITGSGRS